jgi:histidinol-phosphate aminotransferase
MVAGGATHHVTRRVKMPSVMADYVNRLCYNENPLGPSPLAMTAITNSIDMCHRYPDWYAESLRYDLASLHGVSYEQTIAGCGATEILRLCALAFADPGGNVVCPYPSYSQFPSDAELLGATVRYSNLDANHCVDLTDMAARVDSNTTAVCITNANNPTGTVLAALDIESFVDSLPSQVVAIMDEAYHEYIDAPSYQSAMQLVRMNKKVIVIRTFSKVYGLAGARIGYAIGRESEIEDMEAYHLYATISKCSLEGAIAALTDSTHVADTVSLSEQAKTYCFNQFDIMGLEYIPSETNFFMVDVDTNANTVRDELSSRGIYVRSGWGMPQHLRVSTGTMEEMETFINALADILGITGSRQLKGAQPVTSLGGNFPNPLTRTTSVSYSVAKGGPVLIQVFNIRGQLVKTIVNQYKLPGRHGFDWDGRNEEGAPVAAGSYFYRMTARNTVQTRRMIVVR